MLPFPDPDQVPAELAAEVAARAKTNIYRMVAHSRGLGEPFLHMADALLQANSLPPTWRELAILRVGHVHRAPYEIHHHTLIAERVGLSADAIAASATGRGGDLPEEEARILEWTDVLLAEHRLVGDQRDTAMRMLTIEQLADLALTVGFYQMACNFLNTFEITTDGEAPLW